MTEQVIQPTVIRFVVQGPPVGKERARFGGFSKERPGKPSRPIHYTPTKTKDYEKRVRLLFGLAALGKLPPGFNARRIRVVCFFKNGIHPDPDNVKHAVIDALKGVAYKKDDRNIGSSVEPPLFDKLSPRVEVEVEG